MQVLELERAVELALSRVDLEETLVIVTADHSHGFTLSGYPNRGEFEDGNLRVYELICPC